MANPERPSDPSQSPRASTERRGLGQSGYTAGRRDADPALDRAVDTRHGAHPAGPRDGLGTDDRFTGRGRPVSRDDDPEDGPDASSGRPPHPHENGAPDEARDLDDHPDDRSDGVPRDVRSEPIEPAPH